MSEDGSPEYESHVVLSFGYAYFNGVRWGALSSALFFGDQARRSWRQVRCSYLKQVPPGQRSVPVLGPLRFGVTRAKVPLIVVAGATFVCAHSVLAALLANLRASKFAWSEERGRCRFTIDPCLQPTFWDGFVVGWVGSVADADLPEQPPTKYLNFRAGW